MSDKDKKQGNPSDDEKLHITENIFETSADAKNKAAEEERQREQERQRIIAEKRRKAEEERDKRLEAERLELLRLKQGIIEESETIHEEHEEIAERTFFQKIGDFFYSNKWWLWIAVVFAAIIIWLFVNLLNKPRPDMVILVIGENYALGAESSLAEYAASFAEDFNNNGEVLVSVYYIPYTGNATQDYANGVDGKLTTELQAAEGVILIGNELAESVLFENSLVDLSELYPDNEHIDGDKFMLNNTDFALKTGLQESQISDDWFISIRKPQKLLYAELDEMQEVYNRDFVVFDSIIKDLGE